MNNPDIFTLISPTKVIFEEFRKWLFGKLGKNVNSFKAFSSYPNFMKTPYLIQFLESKGVNILEAACYYNCKSSNQASSFDNLMTFLIIEEFKRIETKKVIDYVPF